MARRITVKEAIELERKRYQKIVDELKKPKPNFPQLEKMLTSSTGGFCKRMKQSKKYKNWLQRCSYCELSDCSHRYTAHALALAIVRKEESLSRVEEILPLLEKRLKQIPDSFDESKKKKFRSF